MLKNLKTTCQKVGLTILSSVFLLQTNLILPASTKAQTPKPNISNSKAENFYKQAEQQLPENYYVVYRIIDRIARANNLDQNPWRVIVTSNDNVNAYATEFNLLVFEKGILDQLQGNASALACVIGHEMGHHVKQHLGYGPAEKVQVVAKAEIEAEQQKTQARQNAQNNSTLGGLLNLGLNILGGQVGGDGGTILQSTGAVVDSASKDGLRNIEQTEKAIDQQKEAKIQQRIIEINHRQEFEADELGYIYSVKAGFKSDGCVKTMELLGRSHGSQLGSESHPAPKDRTAKIEALMVKYPPETLKKEGENRLFLYSNPLNYQNFDSKLSDGNTVQGLQIKPSTGDTKTNLENLFNN